MKLTFTVLFLIFLNGTYLSAQIQRGDLLLNASDDLVLESIVGQDFISSQFGGAFFSTEAAGNPLQPRSQSTLLFFHRQAAGLLR